MVDQDYFADIEKPLTRKKIKRHYVKLIRQYTPEKHPKIFQIIREQYEDMLNDFIYNWDDSDDLNSDTNNTESNQKLVTDDASINNDTDSDEDISTEDVVDSVTKNSSDSNANNSSQQDIHFDLTVKANHSQKNITQDQFNIINKKTFLSKEDINNAISYLILSKHKKNIHTFTLHTDFHLSKILHIDEQLFKKIFKAWLNGPGLDVLSDQSHSQKLIQSIYQMLDYRIDVVSDNEFHNTAFILKNLYWANPKASEKILEIISQNEHYAYSIESILIYQNRFSLPYIHQCIQEISKRKPFSNNKKFFKNMYSVFLYLNIEKNIYKKNKDTFEKEFINKLSKQSIKAIFKYFFIEKYLNCYKYTEKILINNKNKIKCQTFLIPAIFFSIVLPLSVPYFNLLTEDFKVNNIFVYGVTYFLIVFVVHALIFTLFTYGLVSLRIFKKLLSKDFFKKAYYKSTNRQRNLESLPINKTKFFKRTKIIRIFTDIERTIQKECFKAHFKSKFNL